MPLLWERQAYCVVYFASPNTPSDSNPKTNPTGGGCRLPAEVRQLEELTADDRRLIEAVAHIVAGAAIRAAANPMARRQANKNQRDVAQTEERRVWDPEAAGSTPAVPTRTLNDERHGPARCGVVESENKECMRLYHDHRKRQIALRIGSTHDGADTLNT